MKISSKLLFFLPFVLLSPFTRAVAQGFSKITWQHNIIKSQFADSEPCSVTVESFGAVGDGQTDDTKAFQAAFKFAQKAGNALITLCATKTYKITNSINLDYRGQGQLDRKGVQVNGNGASIFLAVGGGGRGYYAFNILTDPLSQQNTKFNFNNLWFYTDNANRPNGIYNTSACFVIVQNCVFYQLATAVNFEHAGMCRFDNCYFWGCVDGIKTFQCKDTYIDGCHAYGCDKGYTLAGLNNAGSDGNVSIVNSVGNASRVYNLKMKGLYTPMIADCVFEQSPSNILIESCNFGSINNVFSGPGNILFSSSGLTNDYWNISNVNTQGRIDLNSLKFSNITNFKVHGVNGNNNPSRSSIHLSNCYQDNFAGLIIRESGNDLSSSITIDQDCSVLTFTGVIADKSIFLKGSNNQRPGNLSLVNGIINGGVVAADNQMKPSEKFNFINPR